MARTKHEKDYDKSNRKNILGLTMLSALLMKMVSSGAFPQGLYSDPPVVPGEIPGLESPGTIFEGGEAVSNIDEGSILQDFNLQGEDIGGPPRAVNPNAPMLHRDAPRYNMGSGGAHEVINKKLGEDEMLEELFRQLNNKYMRYID